MAKTKRSKQLQRHQPVAALDRQDAPELGCASLRITPAQASYEYACCSSPLS